MTQLLLPSGGGGSDPNAVSKALVNAKGDLLVGDAADSLNRLGVGADDTVLLASAAEALGLKWTSLAAAIAAGITTWVGAADNTLDTLIEIGERLEDDQDVVAALISTVAGKLAIANNLDDLADAATARTNLGATYVGDPAVGFPVAGQSHLTQVRFLGVLDHTGPPEVADGTFAANDAVWDSSGQQYLCSIGGTPGTWLAVGSGKILGQATMASDFTMTTAATEEDVPGLSVPWTFDGRPVRGVVTPLPTSQNVAAVKQITAKICRSSDNALIKQGFRQTIASTTESQQFAIETASLTANPSDASAFTVGTSYTWKVRIVSGSSSKASVWGGIIQPVAFYVITC